MAKNAFRDEVFASVVQFWFAFTAILRLLGEFIHAFSLVDWHFWTDLVCHSAFRIEVSVVLPFSGCSFQPYAPTNRLYTRCQTGYQEFHRPNVIPIRRACVTTRLAI